MSRLYDNIKVLCKYKGVQIRDIEKPLRAGTISRYERRGTIMNLPIGLVHRASKLLDVSIEDLLEKDIANEIWGEKMSNEIYGIFKRSELSDELVEDLHKQVDLILEYAKKQKAEQTEPNSSEKPNNCEHITEDGVTCAKYPACDDCLDNPLNKLKGSERLVKGSEQTEPTISKMEQVDEPKTQTETQNSNLTFEKRTMRDCYNCKRYETDGECVECHYEPKDEPQTDCNKLINEVVKLDMSREDKFKVMELLARHCEKCKHYLFTDIDGYYCEHETYGQPCGYEPKDEPQTERSE